MAQDFYGSDLLWWEYKGIRVAYRPSLDGHGSLGAPDYISIVREHRSKPGGYRRAFEWCAGPGFIGFALLAEGICSTLCLADINPEAVECVKRTIDANGLADRVTVYQSDNLKSVPESERFDLVIGNPPNFYSLNPLHPATKMIERYGGGNTLRAVDPRWAIHAEFYRTIGAYLEERAPLLIYEADPFAEKFFMMAAPVHQSGPFVFHEPYDIRPRPPIEDFRLQMRRGGLRYVETITAPTSHYMPDLPTFPFWIVCAEKDREPDWAHDVPIVAPGGRILRPVVLPPESETFVVYLAIDEAPNKQLKITPDGRWLVSMFEAISSRSHGATGSELASRFGLDLEELWPMLDDLYVSGWIDRKR